MEAVFREAAPRSCYDACRPSCTLNQTTQACRIMLEGRPLYRNKRCAQQSCARKTARAQVSTTFTWKSSKLVETRWCHFFVLLLTIFSSKAASLSGFKVLRCAHFGRARLTRVKTRAEEKLQSFYPTPSAAGNMEAQHPQCTLLAGSCSTQQVEVTMRACFSRILNKLTTES